MLTNSEKLLDKNKEIVYIEELILRNGMHLAMRREFMKMKVSFSCFEGKTRQFPNKFRRKVKFEKLA